MWEKKLEQKLMELTIVVQWNKLKVDTWDWVGEDTTSYTVQFGYRSLQEEFHILQLDWCREIWELKVAGTTKVFGWRAMLNRLPSRLNLERRGIIVSCNYPFL